MNLVPTGPPRKPLKIALAELEKQRGFEIQRGFDREMRIEQAMQESENLDGIPGIKALLQMVREQMLCGSQFEGLPADEAGLRRMTLEQLAYSTANLFVDFQVADDGGARKEWKVWDFDKVLSEACSIVKYTSTEQIPVLSVETTNDLIQLSGKVAIAFERYMVFLGVFAVANAKQPCPACAGGPPAECPECGGIGWIIKPEVTL